MKIVLIGQNIPMKLPTLLADLLFSLKTEAEICIEEKDDAIDGVIGKYSRAIIRKSGLNAKLLITNDRQKLLEYADCVIYDGDVMPGSCFAQDREALASPQDDDPGLTDQARVNGGIEGILHTMRQAKVIHKLCTDMRAYCPSALVVTMAQPIARCVEMFELEGFSCYGLGNSPLTGESGIEGYCRRFGLKVKDVDFSCAGLPGFSFLTGFNSVKYGKSLLGEIEDAVSNEEFGRMARRWLDWYGMVCVGSIPAHAEFLPAEPDFIPEEKPSFGETVERRKERILYMNKVGDMGANSQEGAMSQLLLLSKASPERPMLLAVSLIEKRDLSMQAVTRRNNNDLPQLEKNAIIEAELVLSSGRLIHPCIHLTDELADICYEIDESNRLCAKAALGDRASLRRLIDSDPAMEGLDRMYCHDVVDRMIAMQGDLVLDDVKVD